MPPVVINPGSPALDITVVSDGGRMTIVAVDSRDNNLSLYARENGGFGPVNTVAVGGFIRVGKLSTGLVPAQVVAGDLNGDGIADLVVRDAGDGSASVFLGLPGGGFKTMPAVPIGLGNSSLTLADLDASNHVGLIVTNQVTGDVRYDPGLGNGTFGSPSRYQAGAGPYFQAETDDIASDDATAGVAYVQTSPGGPLGLVTINPGTNTLAVLDGLGEGSLANARIIDTTTPATAVVAGDFTGDGLVDLAVLGSDGVTIYLPDGRGGFTRGQTIPVTPDATGLSVVDLYGNGTEDLLVGDTFGDVLILVGNGDGTFENYVKTDRAIALAVADLTGNGQQDFIYANQGLDQVSVQYPKPGESGVTPPTTQAVPQQGLLAPGAVSLIYFKGNPVPDLVVANSGSNNILVYPGLGNGQFGPALNGGHGYFTGTNPVGITVADLNGDGVPDLVVANQGSNTLSIFYGVGTGADYELQPGPHLSAGEGPVATVVETLPGNPNPDILVSDGQSNKVLLIPGLGQGFFDDQRPQTFNVGMNPGPIFVGNFAGVPGELDLVTVNAGSNDLSLIRDFDSGGTTETISISSGGIDPVAAIAFQDDGEEDLIVANEGDGEIALFLGGLGDLAFSGELTNPNAPNPTSLALDALTGNVLNFYASTEGLEAATKLAFNLAGGEGEGGGGEDTPIIPPTPSTTTVQQVAQLLPLGGGSSLELVASLTTVTLTLEEAEETAEAGALPNQPRAHDQELVAVVEETGVPEEEGPPNQPPDGPAPLSPLYRFLYGLDEALERVRLDARNASIGPRSDAGGAGRAILALDTVLARWSPALSQIGGPSPALVGNLTRVGLLAARATDAALLELSRLESANRPDGAVEPEVPRTLEATRLDTLPTVVAMTSIGLLGINRLVRVGQRHGGQATRG